MTNGLGGYASGTVSGAITRRYHGLLISALPNPLGRMMMLNGLSERLRLPDRRVVYTGAEELAGVPPESTLAASEFRLEAGLPVWRYDIDGFTLEKRLLMIYRQNTVQVTYRLLAGDGRLRLGLRPAIHFRGHDEAVSTVDRQKYVLTVCDDQFEIYAHPDLPKLRLMRAVLRRPSPSTGKRLSPYLTPPSAAAVTIGGDRSGAPAISVPIWASAIRSRSSHRRRAGRRATLSGPDEAMHSELNRRALLLAAAPPAAREGLGAELIACRRSVPHNPGRPRGGCGPRARLRR